MFAQMLFLLRTIGLMSFWKLVVRLDEQRISRDGPVGVSV
jgi:hypothetical protein